MDDRRHIGGPLATLEAGDRLAGARAGAGGDHSDKHLLHK